LTKPVLQLDDCRTRDPGCGRQLRKLGGYVELARLWSQPTEALDEGVARVLPAAR
jgi:hypothetical protein